MDQHKGFLQKQQDKKQRQEHSNSNNNNKQPKNENNVSFKSGSLRKGFKNSEAKREDKKK